MKRLLLLLAAVLLVTGCGAASLDKSAGVGECGDNYSTLSLIVTPVTVTRGDAVDIDVTWTTEVALTAPILATLVTGDHDEIEVDVPLTRQTTASANYAYTGSQLNPFGAGVPAGPASVVATAGKAPGCDTVPTAAASFELR